MKPRVLVGMSGGVDSSVCAALLLEQGYDVEGVTFLTWAETKKPFEAVKDAKKVCDFLGIAHRVLDSADTFFAKVVAPFIADYEKGITPNPCVVCNRTIKFGLLAQYAKKEGFDFIATGHYVRIACNNEGQFRLQKGKDEKKDQSYFLYQLTQEDLKMVKFPLGEFSKDQVRALAEEKNIPTAKRPDSQEICFVPDKDYSAFLKRNSKKPAKPGPIFTKDGKQVGQHQGLIHYTVGQRKGLGAYGRPVFVLSMDPSKNSILLGEKGEEYAEKLVAGQAIFLRELAPEEEGLEAKIRYRHSQSPCKIKRLEGNRIEVSFLEPQRAITPGQAVVFYEGDLVLGGATIEAIL